MARKKSSRRRKPVAPRPTKRPRARPTSAPDVPAPVAPVVHDESDEELTSSYHYVTRDLRRIAVLAVLLFAAIYASQVALVP